MSSDLKVSIAVPEPMTSADTLIMACNLVSEGVNSAKDTPIIPQLWDAIAEVLGNASVIVHTTTVVDVLEVIVALPAPDKLRSSLPTSPSRKVAAPAVKLIPVPVVAAGVSVVAGIYSCS